MQVSADLAGRAPIGQINNHVAAKNLHTIQQSFLRATPGHAGGFASFLSPISFVKIHLVGDLTTYHRRATRN